MIALIQDETTLRQIGPNALVAYLRSHAWKQVEQVGDKATIWTANAHDDEYEILVPLNPVAVDYARRISQVLQTLQVAEQRSQLEIARDIATTSADTLRVRLAHGLVENGTLPLEQGILVIQSIRKLILAAACAAVSPRAFYPSRKPQEALSYVSGLRIGQTEQGSFVIPILSPVPPRAVTEFYGEAEEPFERRAMLTLAAGLNAVQRAISHAAATGDFQSFQNAVDSGVSADLCEALLDLSIGNTAEEVSLSIQWSPTRRAEAASPAEFYFQRDTFLLLRTAERILREAASQEEIPPHQSVRGPKNVLSPY